MSGYCNKCVDDWATNVAMAEKQIATVFSVGGPLGILAWRLKTVDVRAGHLQYNVWVALCYSVGWIR